MSSMYRIARAAGQTRERRAQATHPSRARPELLARGPSEVWSWDITALKGPRKGEWYKLYVVLDIFSRYVTGWLVAHAEDAVVARDFLAGAVAANQIVPHTIHADRGGSMTSKPVSEMMIDLGVRRSHSRPRCSNDNPYSEAQFKTLKYVPDFPDRFGSLADARVFCDRFFTAYNHEHATPGSACTRPPRSTSAPLPRSAHTASTPSTAPTSSIPSASAGDRNPRACPRQRGSTSPSQSHPSKDQLSRLT